MGLFTMMESGRKASDFFNVAAVDDRRIPARQRPILREAHFISH
jgi:hypothetical protein